MNPQQQVQALQRQLQDARQQQQAMMAQASMGPSVPSSFFEWLGGTYPADEFIYNQQWYGVSVAATASNAAATGNISVANAMFVMGFRSKGIITATGAAVTYPYRIGIQHASGNDWTFGQWLSSVVTGDGAYQENQFYWPREVSDATQLTVTVNNALFATAITVDAVIVGIEVRRRSQPVRGR